MSSSTRLAAAGRTLAGVLAAGLLCFSVGYQSISDNVIVHLRPKAADTAAVAPHDGTDQGANKWLWATQWSLPPEETIDAAVPGFFGWGSSNPENPYRGRIGQTEGFPQHRQGLPNLNDISQYLGAVIVALACIALYVRRRSPEVWFLAAAAVLALVLSYGKYGPLYRLFFDIPFMDTMRNPIKWFYLTSLAVGVLGTIGLASLLRPSPRDARPGRLGVAVLTAIPAIIFLASGAFYLATRNARAAGLFWQTPNVPDAAAAALAIAAFFWTATVLIIVFLMFREPNGMRADAATDPSPRVRAGYACLVCLMFAELLYVDMHYLPYKDADAKVDGGALSDYLERQPKPYRVHFAFRDRGLDYALRYMAGHYGWETITPGAMRETDEITYFLNALYTRPATMLSLAGVRYIVSQYPINQASAKPLMTLGMGQNSLYLYENTNCPARYFLVPDWETVAGTNRFARLGDPDFDPRRKALIHASPDTVPPTPAARAGRLDSTVTSYRPHRIEVVTRSDAPAMLVGLDRFDPGWRVRIDGHIAPLFQANGILRACPVPAGEHRVVLTFVGQGYSPLVIVLLGWLAALLCSVWAFVSARQAASSVPEKHPSVP